MAIPNLDQSLGKNLKSTTLLQEAGGTSRSRSPESGQAAGSEQSKAGQESRTGIRATLKEWSNAGFRVGSMIRSRFSQGRRDASPAKPPAPVGLAAGVPLFPSGTVTERRVVDTTAAASTSSTHDIAIEVDTPQTKDQNKLSPENTMPMTTAGSTQSLSHNSTEAIDESFITKISSLTPPSEIIASLVGHGCEDVSNILDLTRCGEYPIEGGIFSDTYRGELRDGTKVAIKRPRVFLAGDNQGHKELKHMARELYMWSKLNHPNILELVGLALFRNALSIVSLWMDNGTLPAYLAMNPGTDRIQMCIQVSAGLEYLHYHNIVHGNLKGYNILVSQAGIPRLSGFGNAALKTVTMQFTATGTQTMFSVRWAAPELLKEGNLSKPTDVYALGMTLLEIITGRVPFHELTSDMQVIYAVFSNKSPERPTELDLFDKIQSDTLWNLMSQCWILDPEARPNARYIAHTLRVSIGEQTRSSQVIISRKTLGSEIIAHLVDRGVEDVTSKLDLVRCGTHPIAGGGFGDVYSGQLLGGQHIAIKCPRLFLRQEGLVGQASKNIAQEVYTWSKLKHPNVLELIGLATFQNQISIVSPWMKNGTLPNYLKEHYNVDRFKLCLQILSGLAYLHDSDTVHGDVKGSNILVSDSGVAKLTDFGNTVLKKYTIEFTGRTSSSAFSLRWAAPELFDEESDVTRLADVYALGMTFLEIITGEVPYSGIRMDPAVILAITTGKIPERPPQLDSMEEQKAAALWEAMSQCWDHEPGNRPSVSEVEANLRAVQ